jgi:hypothetical protein
MRTLTASDRSSLIRLASGMPKGDPTRHAIIAGLKTAGLENRLDDRKKQLANAAMSLEGLDGNRLFLKATDALSLALKILWGFGIDVDKVVDSYKLSSKSNTLNIDLTFTNPNGSFSPEHITNSKLRFSYMRSDNGKFEVLAYLT